MSNTSALITHSVRLEKGQKQCNSNWALIMFVTLKQMYCFSIFSEHIIFAVIAVERNLSAVLQFCFFFSRP